MDNVFSLFFNVLFDISLTSLFSDEKPKIEVRLLPSCSNKENKFTFEIENITNRLINLKSARVIYVKDSSSKPFLLTLHLTEEQLSLPPFFPIKLKPMVFNENEIIVIKYIEFKLINDKKLKVKTR
jgi:hypothetical protein